MHSTLASSRDIGVLGQANHKQVINEIKTPVKLRQFNEKVLPARFGGITEFELLKTKTNFGSLNGILWSQDTPTLDNDRRLDTYGDPYVCVCVCVD